VPDWSYGTGPRSALFLLDPARARDLTLSALGALASLPGGPRAIALLGHMEPSPRLRRVAMGVAFPSPVGLGAGLDVRSRATHGFVHFGFGFIEFGPVAHSGRAGAVALDEAEQSIHYARPRAAVSAERLRDALSGRPHTVAFIARLGYTPGATIQDAFEQRRQAIGVLAPVVDAFSLDTHDDVAAGTWSLAEWSYRIKLLVAVAQRRPVIVVLPPDTPDARAEEVATAAIRSGVSGISVADGVARGEGRVVGAPTQMRSIALVRHLRDRLGPETPILASGGILQPADALAALDAGATLVQVHSGFVFAGPGLPKRINEAVLAREATTTKAAPFSPRYAWLAFALLGLGMMVGGVLAWYVAATSTLLEYEEEFVGLGRDAIAAIDPQILAFMAHDRVSLAGGMVSLGLVYLALAVFGVRTGSRWARNAIVASATVGFASFALFLGYRYFDPLHAIVTLLLLPFFVLGLRRLMTDEAVTSANLYNDAGWRAGLWGQLAFVMLGAGLTVGGATICFLGASVVFVPSDLEFLGTTAAALDAANARLMPLIAHDRAGLGGLLASEGIALLLTSLWGFREGARWLWWSYLLAGVVGFAGALGVHVTTGYLDLLHLLPALTALVLFAFGLATSRAYLWASRARPVGATARAAQLAR
jgi:dihydroorotate dehydrogenase